MPAVIAGSDRSAYYRREADRIDVLASGASEQEGRESFAEAAREYRALADQIENPPADEPPLDLGAVQPH